MFQRIVTIDIETLPAADRTEIEAETSPSRKNGDPYLNTALSGDFGRVLCIGFTDENGKGILRSGIIGWDADTQSFHCEERRTLSEFWQMMDTFNPRTDCIVGHNIFDFDLKFIHKRSVVNQVKPSINLSFARYRSQPIFDTMAEWEKWSYGTRVSLDRLASVLGLRSSKADGVNGSRIFELYEAGEHQAIYDYCLRDVRLTREIYRRLVFADITGPAKQLTIPAQGVSQWPTHASLGQNQRDSA